MTIILAIKPEYFEKIMTGQKVFEFRKSIPKTPPDKIIFYVSSPISKICGWCNVKQIIKSNPDNLWNKTKDKSGITKEFFDKYFSNKNCAFAYEITQPQKYDKPENLQEFGLKSPPQNFAIKKEA